MGVLIREYIGIILRNTHLGFEIEGLGSTIWDLGYLRLYSNPETLKPKPS